MSTSARHGRSHGKKVVAVEIGRDWLKVAEGHSAGRAVVFSKLHLERIDEESANLAQTVTAACRDLNLGSVPAILVLPRHMVTVRILKLPSRDPSEVADMVDLQVSRQSPYSRDEILADYRILGSEPEGFTRVLLAMAQRSIVSERVSMLEEAGLDVERVCLSSEGLYGWLAEEAFDSGTGRGLAVLEVDAAFAEFCVSLGRGIVFSRSIQTGARALQGQAPGGVEALAGELKRCLDACRTDCPGLEFDRLLVTGAKSALSGLAAELQSHLGMPVESVDALSQVKRLPQAVSMAADPYRTVSLTALIGVLLFPGSLELDLTPETVMLRKRLVVRSRRMTEFGVLLMTCAVGLSMLGTLGLYFRHYRLEQLARIKSGLEERVRLVERQRSVIELVRERQSRGRNNVNLLAEVQRSRVENLYVTQMDVDQDRGRMTISGSGASMSDVRTFVNNLDKSPLLGDIKPGNTTLDREGRYAFQVSCGLEVQP